MTTLRRETANNIGERPRRRHVHGVEPGRCQHEQHLPIHALVADSLLVENTPKTVGVDLQVDVNKRKCIPSSQGTQGSDTQLLIVISYYSLDSLVSSINIMTSLGPIGLLTHFPFKAFTQNSELC